MENLVATSRFMPVNENNQHPTSTKSLNEEHDIEPFSARFYIKMIRLEEIIYSQEINQKSLGELLSLYAVKKFSIKFKK